MKPLVCIYCEGNDTKIAVLTKENGSVKIIRAASIDVVGAASSLAEKNKNTGIVGTEAGLTIDSQDGGLTATSEVVFESIANSELVGIKLHNCLFVPALTEPSIYYQVLSSKTKADTDEKLLEKDASKKKKKIDEKNYCSIELASGQRLTAYLTEDISCFKAINGLARYNRRRFYKIVSVKSAEITLANYIARAKKFFPDDYSLIVYIGKDYSKLIFLQGRKLKHIGATLDVGTSNLNTYDVYFSKILLEMENSGIPNLDNIVVCGEDDSENLILSFYGTFPEANVSRLEFENISVDGLSEDIRTKISAYAVPIATATEYFSELAKEYTGINLLPNYIREEQKVFQFGWHGYMIIPLLFLTAFYVTNQILSNKLQLDQLKSEIAIQDDMKRKNMEIFTQIETLDARISSFDQTQSILDTISKGSEIWGKMIENLADFAVTKKNFWVRNIAIKEGDNITLDGHALNKFILTDFTSRIDSATLRNISYDPIKEKDAYRYSIDFYLQGLTKIPE
jgi:hypothetical protein